MSESTPDVATQPGDELLLELADDYLRRYRAGEEPTVDEYVAKHPELADRICELFPAMIAMEQPGPSATVDLAPPTERVGAIIGRYKLLERIGEGGFGVVYMAEQQHPVRRKVALKVVKPGMDSRQVLARFEAERQALAILDHPNIAKVFDAGATDSGRPYFVMELIKGEPITGFCDRNHFSPQQRLELFAQVCHAIQHAHQKGIIHRDIKPTNVLVGMHDTTPVVKVIDFGVAKALGQELTDKTLFTGFAQFLGTPLYMSPEQAGQSVLDVDTRSDIYSLGVLLYELLTGTTPFDKERFKKAAQDEILRIIREEEPPKPSTRLSESKDSLASISAQRQTEPAKLTKLVRGELDWIVMKALEKDRARRYDTASAFAADIERYMRDEPVQACPPSTTYRLRKFVRRNKATLATASLVGVALLCVVGSLGWAVRDRSARQTKVAAQVDSILTEVDRLEVEQNWRDALATARRAEAVLSGGDADAATSQRVQKRLKDLEFIDRLEQIRLDGGAEADRAYTQAFRDYGVNIKEASADESISHLKARAGLTVPVAAALDRWVLLLLLEPAMDSASWERLVAVARGIDPEPLRDQLRSAWGQPAAETRDELRQLAASIDVRTAHPATLICLYQSLRRVELPDPARRMLREAQIAYPGDFWINGTLARELAAQGDFEGAVRFYTAAVSLRPYSADASYGLGHAIGNQNKRDESNAAYRRALEIEPGYYPARVNIASNLTSDGKVDEAIEAYRTDFDKAIDLAGEAIESETTCLNYYLFGNLLRDLGRLDEAIDIYHKAIELDPKDSYAHGNLARTLNMQGKPDEAIAAYRMAIEADPLRVGDTRQTLSQVLRQQGKLDDAIAVCREAVEVDPQDARTYHTLGLCLRDQGNRDEAFAAFSKGIEINPNNPELRGVRASAYVVMGQWDKAEADYEKQLQLNPTDQWPWYFRGCILAYLGRKQEYGEHCHAMLTQFADTTDYGILERTAKSALLMPDGIGGDVDQLTRRVELACLQFPNSYWNLLLKGMAECRAGRYEEATGPLEKCREVPPDDFFARTGLVTADAFLAVARYRLGQVEEARAALDRATDHASKIWPPVGSSDWSKVNADHWLIAQTSMREAALLIVEQQVTTAPSQ
jgi:serine/threonine protein kinase/tetratricopeptide (TPR) repeat protein